MPNLMTAHNQWATRPRDERFHSLEDLFAFTNNRRNATWQHKVEFDKVWPEVITLGPGQEAVGFRVENQTAAPSNWSFGQYARLVSAPPSYLSTLSPGLAVDCLRSGRDRVAGLSAPQVAVMGSGEEVGDGIVSRMRAVTSPSYGRIWDADVVTAVQKIAERSGGKFHPPKAYVTDDRGFAGINGKTETSGLFASDRDVFMFMIDGGSYLEGGGRDQLHRGFIVMNSEVGSAALTIMTFLFRGVCGNLIIWGSQDVNIARIRHSTRAGIRFADEAYPALIEFSDASARPTEELVARAKARALPWVTPLSAEIDLVDEQRRFMKQFSLTGIEFKSGISAALQFEGQCDSVWDMVQGLTRYSQTLAYTDARLDLDKRAGKILDLVA